MVEREHKKYFYKLFLNLDFIPEWSSDYWRVSSAIAELQDIQSAIYYGARNKEDFDRRKREIIREFKLPEETVYRLLGLCLSDLSNSFGVLQSFFKMSETKVRLQRVTVMTESESEW